MTSGVLNQELFYQSGGEMLFVWERLRGLVPSLREAFGNPLVYRNLEQAANGFIGWWNTQAPGAYDAFSKRFAGSRAFVGRGPGAQRRIPRLPRHQRERVEHVLELGRAELIQAGHQRLQARKRVARRGGGRGCAPAPRFHERARGRVPRAGTGSRSTTAVVTCVVTRSRTK